jgi:hypothetical protein
VTGGLSSCFDSITQVPETTRGRTVLAASHGGVYVAHLALQLRLGGIVVSDAGVGREGAGVAGLALLDERRVPAAAVSAASARIGDGADCLARGVISFANEMARGLGVVAGMNAQAAFDRLSLTEREPLWGHASVEESRHDLPKLGGVRLVIVDSNSLVTMADKDAIVVTGSHGGLLGGRPASAIKAPVAAAIYNDAAGGIDGAGVSRLPALDTRGIAGATVSAWSARIGDGQSTYEDGFVTHINACAARAGAEIGMSCRALVARLAEAAAKRISKGEEA